MWTEQLCNYSAISIIVLYTQNYKWLRVGYPSAKPGEERADARAREAVHARGWGSASRTEPVRRFP